jgi:HAD superfamily hydrolase (TIGR01458 family)
MPDIRAVLLDIDGVLTVSWRPIPGAVEAVGWLRERGYLIGLVTNTTSRTRAWIAGTLADSGFPVTPADVFTAPAITAGYLDTHHPAARCALLTSGDIAADLEGVTLVADDDPAGQPEVVILGGAGPEFSYAALNRVFGYLRGGAALVAMHRNMFWRTDDGLQLDSGAFLAGLEQAAGVRAEVTGKPADAFFATALAAVGGTPETTLMAGDDIHSDVLAAQQHGMTGVLVRTGKYLEETLAGAPAAPDHVIDSIADLPALLAGR